MPCTLPPDVAGLDLPTANERYRHLSDWCLLDPPAPGASAPGLRARVEPYALTTPLYSDGALKLRTLWMPTGASATYADSDLLEMPAGTLITKTFSFAADLRAPTSNITFVETRILARTGAGWLAIPYTWRSDLSDADLNLAGDVVPQHFLDATGTAQDASYLIPGATQCGQCHHDVANQKTAPIGPRARALNRDYDYAKGTENVLVHLGKVGYLTGAPDPSSAPRLPTVSEPTSGTTEQRARAWLEANCAHCHSTAGLASNTGLDLWSSNSDPRKYGVCKPPVAAGPASAGRAYDVVPGKPDESILMFRIESVNPSLMMPPIGRSLVDTDGVALVRQWITELAGSCP